MPESELVFQERGNWFGPGRIREIGFQTRWDTFITAMSEATGSMSGLLYF